MCPRIQSLAELNGIVLDSVFRLFMTFNFCVWNNALCDTAETNRIDIEGPSFHAPARYHATDIGLPYAQRLCCPRKTSYRGEMNWLIRLTNYSEKKRKTAFQLYMQWQTRSLATGCLVGQPNIK